MATDNTEPTSRHQPYVPAEESPPEFTLPAVLVGAILGIVFGASSLYLVLKVGMTVSASVPIAVLSITLFRGAVAQRSASAGRPSSKTTSCRRPARPASRSPSASASPCRRCCCSASRWTSVRVMTVSVLGGLLGILMMIPLRRAFIVKQHGKLTYPEGTACAEVLVAGEKGGATARDGVHRLRHRLRPQVPDRGHQALARASRRRTSTPTTTAARRSASRARRSAASCRRSCSASAT